MTTNLTRLNNATHACLAAARAQGWDGDDARYVYTEADVQACREDTGLLGATLADLHDAALLSDEMDAGA